MFRRLLHNHVLANLTFVLVLVIGLLSYQMLPRQQDPTVNFNWVVVTTALPGASALDVESKITGPIEDALRGLADINFVSSNSRTSISSVLVRFQDISQATFDKRVADLRREIQNVESDLPEAAEDPIILEITSANAFPSVTIAVVGAAFDDNLRRNARNVEKDLERLSGVDRVDPVGLADPEIQVRFDPAALEALRLTPTQVAQTVSALFTDIAAGDLPVGGENWLVRLVNSDPDPGRLTQRPVVGGGGSIRLGDVAEVVNARKDPAQLASFEGQPAVLMAVMKQAEANTLELVDRVRDYVERRNALAVNTGVDLVLVDDQTIPTRQSINIMQSNALIGLALVLVVAWLFLGGRIALLTAIGIPFILAGTFWALTLIGQTLNVMVLLGVVIVLGMLVDDAVVVVESIYYRLRRGMDGMSAAVDSLREVGQPVLTAVLTTIAAFLPLILLPGILGDFMRVVPIVVSIALAISLVEAFWMLPAHVLVARVRFDNPSRMQRYRERFTHWLQIRYVRILIRAMRYRWLSLSLVVALLFASVGAIVGGLVRFDFFAADPLRIFYVNVEMPPSTPLRGTLDKVEEIEARVREHLRPGESRAVVSYAGNMFTETEPRIGDRYGQILVGLNPLRPGLREVDEIIAAVNDSVRGVAGPVQVSFLRLAGGPPSSKPISVKVRGDEYAEIRAAADELKRILGGIDGVREIQDDASRGRMELVLGLDEQAAARVGLSPELVYASLQLLVDGLVVADMRHQGEKLEIRVQAREQVQDDVAGLLQFRLPTPAGGAVALSELFEVQRQPGLGNVRHYNFRRAITVEADLDDAVIDTVSANRRLQEAWEAVRASYPTIDLDFSGELDDIQESLDSIAVLFIFGVGLMYLILGTQFRSYFQPFMILATVPMAFIGVVLGILITRNPVSLFTLYGMVALAGIAVNSAIVLISAANARLEAGMSLLHATLYAARRRVIPILITALTTIAGLFSLAAGLGGQSLIWGPVAAAIVWGLAFSTVLTLIVIPLLYRMFMPRQGGSHAAAR